MCAGHLTPAFLRTRALKPRVRVVLSAGHIDLMRKVAFHVNILIDFCVQRNVTPCPGNAVPVLQALSLSVALVVLFAGLVGFVSWEDASPGSRGPGQGAGSVRRGGRPGAAAARALPRGRPPPPPRPLQAGGVLAACSLHTGASPAPRAPACAPTTGGRGRISRAVTFPPAVFAGVASTVLPSFDFSRKTKIKINEKKTGAQRLPGGFLPGLRLRMLRAGRIQGVGVFHAFPTGLQRRLLPAWGGRGGRARGGGAAEQPCHVLNSVHAGLPRREAGPSMNLPPARTGAGKEYGW